MNLSAIGKLCALIGFILWTSLLAYDIWTDIQFNNALAESLNRYNHEALQDARNLITYKQIDALLKEGKKKEAQEVLQLYINSELASLNKRVNDSHLNPETREELKALLAEANKL
jgi:hypothetical protein